MSNPTAARTRIVEITLSDGTLITVNSGFDNGGLVTVAMYSAVDLAVDENVTEPTDPVRPVVTLGLSAAEAEIIGEAVTLAAALAFSELRPRLKVVKGDSDGEC
jgi:hypothetical protein